MKKGFLLAIALIVTAMSAVAVPAYPELVRFTQPRTEQTVSIYLRGDERVHWAETEDGYSLVHADDGSLVYATRNAEGDMVATDYVATEKQDRSAEVNAFLSATPKGLRFSQRQVDEMLHIWKQVEDAKSGPKTMSDVVGEKNFLVILFAFQDQSFHFNKLAFRYLFNQINYSANGATGSVHDYYQDVSGGLFSLHVDVVGPYTGHEETGYYGNTDNGYQAFAHEAVDSAAQDVDFSNYDNDGDGYIDGLHIIFAGHGEEAGAPASRIWSHKWNIFNPPTYNNTVIDVYSCSPECSGYLDFNMTAIGVICHELGHVFGAPDYYDTDYAGSGGEFPGLGQWDIMSGGSWNRGGKTPAHHNPYTKVYIYHWADVDTLNGQTGTRRINPVATTNNELLRVNTSTEGDFFLIENRQKMKWDSGIPGHGMLVYHIHPSASGRNLSNARHPQQIYIIAHCTTDTFPSGTPSSYGTVNSELAAFPATNSMRDSLTDYSMPWFRPWSKQPNNMPLTNISENTDNHKVFFTLQHSEPNPLNASAEGLTDMMVELNWERYGGYQTMVVMNAVDSTFGIPNRNYAVGDTVEGGGIVIYVGNDSTLLLDSLTMNHTYYFKFFSKWRSTHFSKGVTANATTSQCGGNAWEQEDFESTENGELPDCWSGSWRVGMLNGQHALMAMSECTTERSWRSATSAPLTFDENRNSVLKFKYMFGESCTTGSRLKVEYRQSPRAAWTEVGNYEWRFGMADWTEAVVFLPEAGDYSRIRFSLYSDCSDYAAIDDISIEAGSLIHATCDANGTIEPYGYTVVDDGGTIDFTVRPLPGYRIAEISYDGTTLGEDGYTIDEERVGTVRLEGVNGFHSLTATFEPRVGIENVEEQLLVAYPNPTGGELCIETNEGGTLTLYNMAGERAMVQTIEAGRARINIERLPKGTYLLHCGGRTAKVVKE